MKNEQDYILSRKEQITQVVEQGVVLTAVRLLQAASSLCVLLP